MVGIAAIKEGESGSIEVDLIEVGEGRILIGFAAVASEPDGVIVGVDFGDGVGAERFGGELVFELAIVGVDVVASPAAALGPPDHVAAGLYVADGLGTNEAELGFLGDERLDRVDFEVDIAEFQVALEAISADKPEVIGGFGPVDVKELLVFPLLDFDPLELFGVAVEDIQFGLTDVNIAWHFVFVGNELGSRLGKRID